MGDSDRAPAERAANRRNWDDLADVHVDSDFYDVPSVVAGESTLRQIERAELADVFDDWAAGRRTRVAHLQCHIGLDTISLARAGADVVGLDFSETSIEHARDIADRTEVDPAFVGADVYDAPTALDGPFDVVFASYGVLCWLPDVARWAEVVADLLASGGVAYLVDYHPFTDTFGWEESVPVRDYFADDPALYDDGGSYADYEAEVEHTESYQWQHTLGDVVTGMAAAGLRVEFLHEHPQSYYRRFEAMTADDDGVYRYEDPELPQLFSIRAEKR